MSPTPMEQHNAAFTVDFPEKQAVSRKSARLRADVGACTVNALPRGVTQQAIERAAEVIARDLAIVSEFLPHFEAVAIKHGYRDDPSGLQCRLTWALSDTADAWRQRHDHATNAALKVARERAQAGALARAIVRAALSEAERILPGFYSLDSMRRLLARDWERRNNHNHH